MQNELVIKNSDNFGDGIPVKAYTVTKGWPIAYHSHEYMQIWYINKGNCTHIVDNQEYSLEAGSILVIPPNVPHGIRDEQNDFTISCLEFGLELITDDNVANPKKADDLLSFTYSESFLSVITRTKPCYAPSRRCRARLESLFDELVSECDHTLPFREAALKADVLTFLVTLARDYDNNLGDTIVSHSYGDYIERAVQYLENNFKKKIYISDLAKTASMSESYFSYFFKEYTGKTFKEYVLMLKVEYSKKMLVESTMTITEIAMDAGFADCAHLNKVFKKEVGLTPLAYRRAHIS